ncbi:MAG: DUF1501 domain-containing protein [Pirellulaceae bacterium]|nr:DUF1501 domain-containing protein [Pirellulaceae bacterium]
MNSASETHLTARRDFLKQLAAAGTAALMAGESRRLFAAPGSEAIEQPVPKADACIVLWMAGGMAAPDTFDPKRYVPFAAGTPVAKIESTFPAIDTAVDQIKITEGLENIARVMDRATLIRSHVLPDLGHILHSRHQYHWHTGYVPPQTFTTAGFFGSEYGPMNLPFPEEAAQSVRPPKGMEPGRFGDRYKLYRQLIDRTPQREFLSGYQQESLVRSMDNAHRLLVSKERSAFDITLEPKDSYEKYDTGRFGRGCLLARRLVEAGARYVEVTTEYVPFLNWDTHANGYTTLQRMKQEIDRPIAQLILDLEARGLLDRTLVILASEFSRDMLVEGKPGSNAADQATEKVDVLQELKHYGQHRHFTGSSCVVMWGGGVKKGHLYGASAPERPFMAIQDPISVTDLHASVYTAMGISPKTVFEIEKRPFYATPDGKGQPVLDLFA